MSKTIPEDSHYWKKIIYGPGGFTENVGINFFFQLVNPVFVIALGVDPALASGAFFIPRIIDAITDPIMGSVSDNWRGRWGRRRPFIVIGSILSALCVAGISWTPEEQNPEFHYYWLVAFLLMATIGSTVFTIPYTALGLETPKTKDDRTSWMAWRSLFHKLSGVGVQWIYWLTQLAVFGGTLAGARTIGLVIALLLLAAGILPALFIKEDLERAQTVKRDPIFRSWWYTVKNRNFLVLAFTGILIFASIILVDSLGFYLQVFYVFEGNQAKAALYKGWAGSAFHITGIISIPAMTFLAKKIGKMRAFELCTLSIAIGGISKYFLFVPGADWLVIIPSILIGPGLVAIFVLLPSLLADIAADDEARTGVSRQGMYTASFQFAGKLSQSLVFLGAGIVINVAGYVNGAGVNQAEGVFDTMRWVFSLTTIGLAVAAFLLLKLYRAPVEG